MAAPDLMLATPTKLARDDAVRRFTADGGWIAELKLDGIRALITVDGTHVRITNRNGVDITKRYPDVVERIAALGITAILDGEIIVYDKGKPSFPLAHKRDAQSDQRKIQALAKSIPAMFVAFDVLFLNGIDVRSLPYDARRARLEVIKGLRINPAGEDGVAMWEFVATHGLEGLVFKRRSARYQGGRRSPDWVKVKRVERITALVVGFDRGEGRRASTFGALRLALLDDEDREVPIGSVGTGFTNADCVAIRKRLDDGDELLVEVEFLELSPDRRLRNPSFKGLRTDIRRADCRTRQLA